MMMYQQHGSNGYGISYVIFSSRSPSMELMAWISSFSSFIRSNFSTEE